MRIRGLEQLLTKLETLGGNIEDTMRKSIDDCTTFVKDEARLRCPVDTGDLRQSILSETSVNGGKITGTVYTNMEYAPYIEFGTGSTGEESNYPAKGINLSYRQDSWSYYSEKLERWVTSNGIPAQPYLYPSLHDNKEQIIEKINNDVKKEIRRLGGVT